MREDIKLSKNISNARVIDGFPGFGLVATIATEFLIEHMKGEVIGRYWFEELPASIAIHEAKIISPVTIFYSEKYNIVIVHSISGTSGVEWKAADLVKSVIEKVSAKELISLEGVGIGGTEVTDDPKVYHYTNIPETKKLLEEKGIPALQEGIIVGVTAALLLKNELPTTCLFAETNSQLPDSKAAAKLIEILDKYIGIEVDYEPLLETAEKFEGKIKDMIEKSQSAVQEKSKKDLNYVG